MGEIAVKVTQPRRRPVRRPGPSQTKMYGFAAYFAQRGVKLGKTRNFFLPASSDFIVVALWHAACHAADQAYDLCP